MWNLEASTWCWARQWHPLWILDHLLRTPWENGWGQRDSRWEYPGGSCTLISYSHQWKSSLISLVWNRSLFSVHQWLSAFSKCKIPVYMFLQCGINTYPLWGEVCNVCQGRWWVMLTVTLVSSEAKPWEAIQLSPGFLGDMYLRVLSLYIKMLSLFTWPCWRPLVQRPHKS